MARGCATATRIQTFLATVRRRLLLRSGLEAAGYGLGALGLGLLGLGLTATAVGPASFWPIVTGTFCVALALAAVAFGVLLPARALRGDRAAARRTGVLAPRLASDLLSAVELAEARPDPRLGGSPPLVARSGGRSPARSPRSRRSGWCRWARRPARWESRRSSPCC